MIDILRAYLKSKHDYELDEFAVFQTEYQPSKLIPIALSVFGVAFLLFIFGLFMAWASFMSFWVLLLCFLVFVLVPLAFRKTNKYDAIIVTPVYLIQRLNKKEFAAVEYDRITSYKLTESGIRIKDHRQLVTLGTQLFKSDIDAIIEILEAKGKTFDPKRDFMIRPVEIRIKDNKITVVDLEEEEKEIDKLYQQCAKDYLMLTPGYLKEIILRNSNIKGTCSIEGDNFSIKFESFEVKDGHPENTTFGSIIAEDCIIIFHKAKLNHIILQDIHDKDAVDKHLPKDFTVLEQYLENAIVSEWKTGKKKFDIIFATGVNRIKLSLFYKEVIAGWNSHKK